MKAHAHRVGILGSGQLARMLAEACHVMGFEPVVFAHAKTDSASLVSKHVIGDLEKFLNQVDVVTIENEFIDLKVIRKIEKLKPVYPPSQTLELIQNKLEQKKNLTKFKIPTSPFKEVYDVKSLVEAIKVLGHTLVLKTQTMGYDGKGTFILDFRKTTPEKFFKLKPDFKGYAEKHIYFKKELAVIVARNSKGQIQAFPPVETFQNNGICDHVKILRTGLSSKVTANAVGLSKKLIKKFKGVGVFGIEMFLDKKNKICVNEIAPRVHNSGHITMDAANVSQFEQHIRAVLGLTLIKPKWTCKSALMLNVLGSKKYSSKGSVGSQKLLQGLELNAVEKFYWYDKGEIKENRKLGHINIISSKNDKNLLKKAKAIRNKVKV